MSWNAIAGFVTFLLFFSPVIVMLALAVGMSAKRGDRDWRLDRLERKVDLILTHLGISHDDQIPEIVVGLARAGRKIEAIKEYRKLTGAGLPAAKREVEFLVSKFEGKASPSILEEP